MQFQLTQSFWQSLLDMLFWCIRVPLILLCFLASCSIGVLGTLMIFRASIWFYDQYLAFPW
jgi:hypothetical protein